MNEKCFALRPTRRCSLLRCADCNGRYDKCPFYKPVWMAKRDTNRRLFHISELSPASQDRIADKYYHEQKPWEKVRHDMLAGAC